MLDRLIAVRRFFLPSHTIVGIEFCRNRSRIKHKAA
jgi:hypothetical protein